MARRNPNPPPGVTINEKAFKDLLAPKSGDRRFVAIPWGRHGSQGVYAHGYEEAANLLVQAMLKEDRGNTLVYPVGFILRHAVELLLKENLSMMRNMDIYAGIEPAELWSSHNLEELSMHVDLAFEELGDSLGGRWKAIKKFLRRWTLADPSGSFFRYSRGSDGKPFQVDDNIDILELVNGAQEAIDYLDGAVTSLHVYAENRAQMESEAPGPD